MMRCQALLLVWFLSVNCTEELGRVVPDQASGALSCRIGFLSPLPSETIIEGENLEVSFGLVDCPELTDFGIRVFWNGHLAIEVEQEFAEFQIPRPHTGYHTIFAQAVCSQGKSRCWVRPVNGTVFFAVRSKSPIGGSSSPEFQAAFLGRRATLESSGLEDFHFRQWLRRSNVPWSVMKDGVLHLLQEMEFWTLSRPEDPLALTGLGRVQQFMGHLNESLETYSKALPFFGKDPESESQALDTCSAILQVMEMMVNMNDASQHDEGLPLSRMDLAYLHHLRAILPTEAAAVHSEFSVSDIVFGVVSGTSTYRTRALAVAETWLASLTRAYVYGDTATTLEVSTGNGACKGRVQRVRQLPIPEGLDAEFLRGISHKDDFFSSVPKFVLGLVDMYHKHPQLPWFYIAGDDTYLLPKNLAQSLSGLDPESKLVVGGHAGLHANRVFLSGGSGLVFSNAMARVIAHNVSATLREWMEWEGAQRQCTPCADIAFLHYADIYFAELVQRPCFYAYWPQHYLPWNDDGSCKWRNEMIATTPGQVADLPDRCKALRLQRGGLGLAASPWWGRNNEICKHPVAFHYLQPRGLRLLHRHFEEHRLL